MMEEVPDVPQEVRDYLYSKLAESPEGWEKTWEEFRTSINGIIDVIGEKEFYPLIDDIFNAYHLVKPKDVRVVIIGQDPYHQLVKIGRKQMPRAVGLSFSVREKDVIPQSLASLFKELKRDLGKEFTTPKSGDLSNWCKQGVMLLNRSLMVEPNKAGSVDPILWQTLLTNTISQIQKHNKKCIYVLWGKKAQAIGKFIPSSAIRLTADHPSGLAVAARARNPGGGTPFIGCGHFSEVNRLFKEIMRDDVVKKMRELKIKHIKEVSKNLSLHKLREVLIPEDFAEIVKIMDSPKYDPINWNLDYVPLERPRKIYEVYEDKDETKEEPSEEPEQEESSEEESKIEDSSHYVPWKSRVVAME